MCGVDGPNGRSALQIAEHIEYADVKNLEDARNKSKRNLRTVTMKEQVVKFGYLIYWKTNKDIIQ